MKFSKEGFKVETLNIYEWEIEDDETIFWKGLKRLVDEIKDSGLKQSLKKLDLTESVEVEEIKGYLEEQGMEHIKVTEDEAKWNLEEETEGETEEETEEESD
jgi:membrane protease subunit (stomatin/prohibitin family)